MKYVMDSDKMEKLEEMLRGVKKPSLSGKKKSLIKNHLLSQIDIPEIHRVPLSFSSLIEHIRQLVAKVELDVSKKAIIKENVFTAIEESGQKRFVWGKFFDFSKRFVSGTLVLMIGFGMFSFLTVDMRVVRAETFTVLESFSGEVTVVRGGQYLNIFEGMEVYEDDLIFTGLDGWAVVNYFDDSVTRLANSTGLYVNKLTKKSETSVESYVEVSLLEGMVWSRVVNLVGDESSFVVNASDVAAVTQKAAFNVEMIEDSVEVEVFNHVVDLQVDSSDERIVKGQKVVVVESEVEVFELEEAADEDPWIASNLISDSQHLLEVEERLLAAKVESVSSDDSFMEEMSLFLTFDDVEKAKKELGLKEQDLVAADLKLQKEDLGEEEMAEIETVLVAFSDDVESFYTLIDEVSYTDAEYAGELEVYIDEIILLYKKDVSLSPEVKELIEELELLGAKDDSELAMVKIDQAIDTLSEIEDVSELGESEEADQLLDKYIEDVDEVVAIIENLDEDDKEELIEDAAKDIDLLIGVVDENVEENDSSDDETQNDDVNIVISEPVEDEYGVQLKGDKPLSPLLD